MRERLHKPIRQEEPAIRRENESAMQENETESTQSDLTSSNDYSLLDAFPNGVFGDRKKVDNVFTRLRGHTINPDDFPNGIFGDNGVDTPKQQEEIAETTNLNDTKTINASQQKKDIEKQLTSSLFKGNDQLYWTLNRGTKFDNDKGHYLGEGSTGEYVILIQKALNLIYKGDPTYKPLVEEKDFGTKTKAAVSKFQKDYGLKGGANGVVGPETIERLDKEVFNLESKKQEESKKEDILNLKVKSKGFKGRLIINNSIDDYKEEIHVVTGEEIKKAGQFYSFAILMNDIGLLDSDADLHFKHTGISDAFDGSDIEYYADYEAVWEFKSEIVRMDMSVPVGSVHITGSSLIDYPLALIGSGIFSQIFKASLRPLYNQAAKNIKSTALGLVNSNKVSLTNAAKWANEARNNLKINFLRSTPEDLRNLIFKYNEKRSFNKWGTKTYDQLIQSGKTDMDIINSAANPQLSLEAVGKDIYKYLGDEALPVLKKYGISPKK